MSKNHVMPSESDKRNTIPVYEATLANIAQLLQKDEKLAKQFPDDPFLAATVKHLATRKKQLQKHILSEKK